MFALIKGGRRNYLIANAQRCRGQSYGARKTEELEFWNRGRWGARRAREDDPERLRLKIRAAFRLGPVAGEQWSGLGKNGSHEPLIDPPQI